MATVAPVVNESYTGTVKQVLSGDAVIVRGQPKGGPPPERQINFSNVAAPKLARRATNTMPESTDEAYAWESREFLRKLVVGKEVVFTIDPKSKTLNREYGCLYLGKDVATGENVTELMVAEGWLTVRRESIRGESNLATLEDLAKSQCKGRWAGNDNDHIRNIKWNIENSRSLVDKFGGKPTPAIVEHVRDGSTVRAFLLPDFYHVTLMISGIRSPAVRLDGTRADPGTQEALGEQAKYFVETRLLQRDINIILETANNNNVVGSIIHPSGNIAEALLREGFAKCIDWSITTVTGGPEKLRAAEKLAKQKKLRLWIDYKAPTSKVSDKDREFSGRVIEVVNGDALVILKADGTSKKIFLASIRPPRLDEKEQSKHQTGKVFRPLFDIPWLYEAREFLRKKLIGQKVSITVDYVQPEQNSYPEKTCCTVKISDINVAEALVSRGLATVVRYRQDDDQRAACYDDLLAAEAKAIKDNKGLHNKKDVPIHRFTDVSDPTKAKTYFSFLKRAGRLEAVPEFVASGSRLRCYIPRETCLITFLLAGITCPRASRIAPGGVGAVLEGEPSGNDALAFTKSIVLQREVQIEIESMDKGGNFIGWLFVDGKNLSVELVAGGLSKVHGTAEASAYYHNLTTAEAAAKQDKLNIWKTYKPEEHVKHVEVQQERKINYRAMVITEITSEGVMYGQNVSDGAALEKLSDILQKELATPSAAGGYKPRKGELCAAKYVDDVWYRALVEGFSSGKANVFYVDYGNRQQVNINRCRPLPSSVSLQSPFSKEMHLAMVKLHNEEEHVIAALDSLRLETESEVLVNTEYRVSGKEFVTVQSRDKVDIAKKLLAQGVFMLDSTRDARLRPLVIEYSEAQEEAKKNHLNIWQYGDITEDDAHEFGMGR